MEESELCIAESAKSGAPPQMLVASRLLAHPEAYRRWEAEHAQLMRRVFPRMARVRTAAQVLAMMGARDPQPFKS